MSNVQRRSGSKELQARPKSFPSNDDQEENQMQPAVRQDLGLPVYGEIGTRSGRESAPLPQTSSSTGHSPSLVGRHNSFQSAPGKYGGHEGVLERIRRSLRPFAVDGSDLVLPVDCQVSEFASRKPHPCHAVVTLSCCNLALPAVFYELIFVPFVTGCRFRGSNAGYGTHGPV